MFLIVIETVSPQQSTIVKASTAGKAWSLGLREGWFTLHFSPQRQNLILIVEHALFVHVFQPQFLHTITTVGILCKTVKKQTNKKTQLAAKSG